jgi:hypothetical protein
MPKLIHTWGVVMEPIRGRQVSAFARDMHILTIFAKTLARERFFVQSFHPSLLNSLPFYWNGFKQSLRFGYVFENCDLDQIWNGMGGSIRGHIRRAENLGLIVAPCDSEKVASLCEKTFENQNKKLPFSAEYLARICDAAKSNGAGECFAAIDREGRFHAASFLAWDHKRAYHVAGGSDPELRSSGAESLLLWTMIKFGAERCNVFDFAGSMLKPVERFQRNFGARLTPYNQVTRLPRPFRLIYP